MDLTLEQQQKKDKWIAGRQSKLKREETQVDMTKAFPGELVETYEEAREKKNLREETKESSKIVGM